MPPEYLDAQNRSFVAVRGRVYLAPLGQIGSKYWLCVSNNVRNRQLGEFLCVRVTTSPKPNLPTVVELSPADSPFVGRIVCDDLGPIYPDDVQENSGALSPATMRRVNAGLKAALTLS